MCLGLGKISYWTGLALQLIQDVHFFLFPGKEVVEGLNMNPEELGTEPTIKALTRIG